MCEKPDIGDKVWKLEPLTPLFGRYRQFSQAEAMEHFISGTLPNPEYIPGIMDKMKERSEKRA